MHNLWVLLDSQLLLRERKCQLQIEEPLRKSMVCTIFELSWIRSPCAQSLKLWSTHICTIAMHSTWSYSWSVFRSYNWCRMRWPKQFLGHLEWPILHHCSASCLTFKALHGMVQIIWSTISPQWDWPSPSVPAEGACCRPCQSMNFSWCSPGEEPFMPWLLPFGTIVPPNVTAAPTLFPTKGTWRTGSISWPGASVGGQHFGGGYLD